MDGVMKFFSVLLLSFLGCTAVFAFNQSFLDQSAMSYFTKEDTALFNHAKNIALNDAHDGKKIAWQNPKTGSEGYFIPSNTTLKNGIKCRMLKIYNMAHQVPGEANYKVCRIQGAWKVVA